MGGSPPGLLVNPGTELSRLAAAYGVATEYDDQQQRRVQVAESSVVAVLGALGVDAGNAEAVRASLATVEAARESVEPPPVVVLRDDESRQVPAGGAAAARLVTEDGTARDIAVGDGRVTLPAGLPWGWHTLLVGEAAVPVCVSPATLPRGRRAWGWMTQLYAMRSTGSWGVGDLHDLRTLSSWTVEHGGGLVLVNPLHAVAPGTPVAVSPYSPASRRWTNPLYLRVEDTSAYRLADPAIRAQVDALKTSGDPDRIDRDVAWQAKSAALQLLWDAQGATAVLPSDFEREVIGFATWCALAEVHGNDWREWPEPLRRPDSPAVLTARRALTGRVRFHSWLQLLCREQLVDVQQSAVAAGMPVGIVHDLAVGTDPAGADAWELQDALALDAHIGAPPDSFNQQGQDWGLPPWHPQRLAERAYAPLRDMTRALLSYAGGVRIDHVLGVFRTWWVPVGGSPRDGTYVRYDADAMLGVIILEAHRAGAIVVGEDLGTTPRYVRTTLAERGVLGTSVLWFERDEAAEGETGPLSRLEDWREATMASASTHDLPTVLGWLRGEHVRVRAELGLLDDPAAEWENWRRERRELIALLRSAGLLGETATEPDEEVLAAAIHVALTRTPSRYVMAALGDAIGELRQPNLPGTTEEYPSWRLPIADADGVAVPLETLLADSRVEAVAAALTRGLSDAVR